MKFIKNNHINKPFKDSVFETTSLAKEDKSNDKINASIGSLRDEKGKLVTYKSVFESEKELSDATKAGYCSNLEGDPKYLKAISKFVLENKIKLPHAVLATPGGTGAVSLPMMMCVNEGNEVLIPEISWGNYKSIIEENNLVQVNYDIYNLEDLFKKIDTNKSDKLLIVINSPCENPCGHSYSYEEWEKIIDKLNSVKKEVILINDVAYIDYANEDAKEYFKLFNKINDNVLVIIAYSASKSFSYYGYRLGALFAINKDAELVNAIVNLFMKKGRTIYSSCNAGAMANVANVLNNHYDEYLKELLEYRALLKDRAKLFINHAIELKIPIYDYHEGFFVTLRIEDNNYKEKVHEELINRHIYTIKVNKGIRVGICSVAKKDIRPLCEAISEVLKEGTL